MSRRSIPSPTLRLAAVTIAALAASAPGAAVAQTLSVAALDRAIAVRLGAEAGTPGGLARPLDARLRLAACPSPVYIARDPAGRAARIACPAAGWSFSLPLLADPARPAAPLAFSAAAPVATAPLLVRRGESVTIIVGGAGFAVTRQGIADQDGGEGAVIRVRLDRAGGALRAEVTGPGEVRIKTAKSF